MQLFQKQPPEVFYKNAALKNFAIYTGKYLPWSLFFIKLQACRAAALLKRDSNTSVFLSILRSFQEHLFWRTSANCCFCLLQEMPEELLVLSLIQFLSCWKISDKDLHRLQNILRLFYFLTWFPFATSEKELDYYQQKLNVKVVSRVAEQRNTQDLKIRSYKPKIQCRETFLQSPFSPTKIKISQ